jgi:AraC-like DNA-binding protein
MAKLVPLFSLLERAGVDVPDFLARAGVDPGSVGDADARVPFDLVLELERRARLETGDELIGLHQGEAFIGFSNVLGYVLSNCSDVAEALEKAVKYQKIVDEAKSISYSIADGNVALDFSVEGLSPAEEADQVDYMTMGIVSYSRILTGTVIPCSGVSFRHRAPRDASEYRRLFGRMPRFESARNALVFERRYMTLPVLRPDRELLAVLEAYASRTLAGLKDRESAAARARKCIIDGLRGEAPSLESVAVRLHMSPRTLQSRLREEGCSFGELLAEGRRDLAREYLKDPEVPIGEVAYLLGFSEASAFHRTFKRWTGTTPGEYRRSVADSPRASDIPGPAR